MHMLCEAAHQVGGKLMQVRLVECSRCSLRRARCTSRSGLAVVGSLEATRSSRPSWHGSLHSSSHRVWRAAAEQPVRLDGWCVALRPLHGGDAGRAAHVSACLAAITWARVCVLRGWLLLPLRLLSAPVVGGRGEGGWRLLRCRPRARQSSSSSESPRPISSALAANSVSSL